MERKRDKERDGMVFLFTDFPVSIFFVGSDETGGHFAE